jgi:DNA-binding IclR family transcriptional regulator
MWNKNSDREMPAGFNKTGVNVELSDGDGPVKSLAIALRIISEFVNDSEDLSVSALSSRLGLAKSQVSRILSTFRENGFLTQSASTRKYRVGLKAYAIGCKYLHSDRLIRESLPLLRLAVDRSNYTAALSILDDSRPFYLAGIEGAVPVDFGSRTGSYFPVHATAPGKVLLAFSSADRRESILAVSKLERLTSHTIVELRELRSQLADVVSRGFAVSSGDRTPGIGSLAVPVFAADGHLAAAISIVYPLGRVAEEQYDYFVSILHEVARTLSLRLGAQAYPFDGIKAEPNRVSTGSPAASAELRP